MLYQSDYEMLALLGGAVAVSAGLIAGGIYLMQRESEEWATFKDAHKCTAVGKISGDMVTGFGVSANGQAVVTVGSTPSKTGWLCDDGITYYR